MAFREVSVIEVREVLLAWLAGGGLRKMAEQAGVDRNTARRYVQAAEAVGVVRGGGLEQLSDEVIGQVVDAVRPVRPSGHGGAWQALKAQRERITTWLGKDLTVVKIPDLLTRPGVVVPYRTGSLGTSARSTSATCATVAGATDLVAAQENPHSANAACTVNPIARGGSRGMFGCQRG